jgi:hypothetical protein
LAAVENGEAAKPEDLTINWDPHDMRGSAREARMFVLRSALVFCAEELGEYVTRVLRYAGETIPDQHPDRIRAAVKTYPLAQEFLVAAALLIRHWRNRIVHRSSAASLSKAEKALLHANAETIALVYKGLDLTKLLADFEADRPTLKDTTALLAMSIRFGREIDSHFADIASPHDVRRWLDAEDLTAEVVRLEKQSTNGGRGDRRAAARQFLRTAAPPIANAYYEFGAT